MIQGPGKTTIVAWTVTAAGALALASSSGCGGGTPSDGSNAGMNVPAQVGPASPPEQVDALVIFDDSKVHDVRLEMAPEDWDSIIQDSRGDELRHANLYIDGVVVDDVGVRPSGESSRVPGNQKMSVRVQVDAFSPSQKVGGFDEIKLSGSWDDPFIVRDRIAYWYLSQFMPAPRMVACTLHVNGEPRGAFEIEEVWSHHSLKPYYAEPLGGLYRIRGEQGTDPYKFAGLDPAGYVPLPWDRKGDANDDMQIGPALDKLAQQPTMMTAAFDVDAVLNFFAGNTLLANTDGFNGGLRVGDHFQYFDPSKQRFFMLPWDPDNTFGSINDPPERDIFENFDVSILSRSLRDDPALREQYLQRLEALMAKVPVSAVNQEIERVYAQVRPSAAADTVKQYPTEHFDWSRGYAEDFIAKRYASVAQQIPMYRAQPPGMVAAPAMVAADMTTMPATPGATP